MANTTNSKISNLIQTQLPFFVRNDHPNFVRFMEAYYEFLEQSGGVVERGKNILEYRDIDKTIDEFAENLYATFLQALPKDMNVDKRMLLKHAKEFYSTRGTEKSIKFLINIMFGDEDISIYYPKKDVLRTSDGKWYVQKSLRIENVQIQGAANSEYSGLQNFVNHRIYGNTSGAFAIVERVDRFYNSGALVDELILSGSKGTFRNGEAVFTVFDENSITKSLTANVFGGVVNSITITNPGSRYNIGDTPQVVGSGSGANLRIDAVSSGNVSSITVISGGAGFQNNDFILISGGGGTGANAQLDLVLADASVHPNSYNIAYSTISLEANTAIGNTKYSNLVSAIVDPANNWVQNSLSFFVYANTGPARKITVISPGNNYTSAPAISILANTRIQELGILGRMQIVNGGSGYQVGDVITFTNILGGFGEGAKANVANVAANGYINRVQFVPVRGHITGGAGYSSLGVPYYPTASITSANGTNGSIIVTNLLGEGATFLTSNTTLGAITKISIIDRGSNYTDGNTSVNLASFGDGTATAVVGILEGAFTYPGRFLNDDGFLSSYNFLQDKDYYQNFSYVIKAKTSIDRYRKVLKDLVHPAGTRLFGIYLLEDMSENTSPSDDIPEADRYIIKTKTYVKTANSINIAYPSHGLSSGNTVSLEFLSGGASNVKNGIYTIISTSGNNFIVTQRRGFANTITILNPGAGYNANSYLVFTGNSNGFFTVNTTGSIVSANIIDYGRYYTSAPTANANGSNTVRATFIVTLDQYANNTTGNVNVSTYFV